MLEVFWNNFFKSEKKQDIKLIKKCPLFSLLKNRELRYMKKILHKRSYMDGEMIFKTHSGIGMYIILKGRVSIMLGSPENQEESVLVSTLKAEDFFGEMALVQNKGYHNMYALANEATQLLGFFQPDLNMIIENRPQMAVKILKQLCGILSHRLQKAEQKILQHSQK